MLAPSFAAWSLIALDHVLDEKGKFMNISRIGLSSHLMILAVMALPLTSCTEGDDSLSPARDLVGTWVGNDPFGGLQYRDNTYAVSTAPDVYCSDHEANLSLVITSQSGNDISGTLTVQINVVEATENCPWSNNVGTYEGPISGTVSSSNVTFTWASGFDPVNEYFFGSCLEFRGTFTTDLMSGLVTDPNLVTCGQTPGTDYGVKGVEWKLIRSF
jgi:hypothetical protein